jgi:hypothetical protein
MHEGDGQLHTLTVLEQLREASKGLWGASSQAYFRVDELLRPTRQSKPPRHPPLPPLSGRDVGPVGPAHSLGDCGFGQRCDRTCCDGRGDCELSGAAVYAKEWDIGDKAASENLAGRSFVRCPGLPQIGASSYPVGANCTWVFCVAGAFARGVCDLYRLPR